MGDIELQAAGGAGVQMEDEGQIQESRERSRTTERDLLVSRARLLYVDGQRRLEKGAGRIPGLHDNGMCSGGERQRRIQRTGVSGKVGYVVYVDPHRRNGMRGLGGRNKMHWRCHRASCRR